MKIQDTGNRFSMIIPKSLGGLVGKPLGFGPIDRGSNPVTDIFFLQQ